MARRPPIYGPEPWSERDGQPWSHWDRWFALVAIVDHDGDLAGVAAALDDHPTGYLDEGAQAKLAHLDDLAIRLATAGIDPAELLADDELDKTVLAKARRKVVTQALSGRDLTGPMRHPPRRKLRERAWELLFERFDLDDVPADKLAFHRRLVESGVRRILDRLQELGIVTVTDVDQLETSVGTEDRGGVVALTDLGVWAVQRMASVYLDAPVVGTLVDAPADHLLRQTTDMAEDAARAEVDAWVAHRDVVDAAAGLVDALPGADDVAIGLAFGVRCFASERLQRQRCARCGRTHGSARTRPSGWSTRSRSKPRRSGSTTSRARSPSCTRSSTCVARTRSPSGCR